MNHLTHIIRKDLVRFRAALVVWGLVFSYLLVQPNLKASGPDQWQDFMHLFSLILLGALSVGLIAGLVQEDHPDDSRAQWRPGRSLPPGW